MENTSCILGDFIGGVTLTGSLIAFGKLNGNLSAMDDGNGVDMMGNDGNGGMKELREFGRFMFFFFL